MKTNRFAIASMSMMFVLAGCGGGGGGSGGSGGSNSALQGTWADECVALNANVYEQATLSISGTEFTQSDNYYTDAICSADAIAVVVDFSGSFVEGESTETDRGTVTEVDITFTSQSEAWHLDGDIADHNTNERCGVSNWEAGVSFDVTNCEDAIDGHPMPITLYDVYLISGDDVFFGVTGSSQTEAGRPTDVSAEAAFSKQ